MVERPSAETLRPMFTKDHIIVLIIGAGGAGKSTLACEIARWALADNQRAIGATSNDSRFCRRRNNEPC